MGFRVQKSFEFTEKAIIAAPSLGNFDTKRKTVLTTNASGKGIGGL